MQHEPELTLIAEDTGWDAGSFLTGLFLGATMGAGVALLFAPTSGRKARRRIGRTARQVRRGAADGWSDTRDRAREILRERRASFRAKVARARAQGGHNGDLLDEEEED